jgi:molecular chaperone GrpE
LFENKENTVSDAARDEKLTELEILRQSFEDKKKQADEYYSQLLRLKADFENFRKRSDKEKQTHLQWGKEEMLLKQIGQLDLLDQARKSANASDNIESIRTGLEMIYGEFAKLIASEGVKEIESMGKKFDPELHEAVEKLECDREDDTILEVVQKGYIYNTRVVRPAKVKVAKHKPTETKELGG